MIRKIIFALLAATVLAAAAFLILRETEPDMAAKLLESGFSGTVETPSLDQIKNICELATLKCSYQNIAKSIKKPGTGLSHLFEKERAFWIEYQGTVEISFDISRIKMETNGTEIKITLPEPKLVTNVIPESLIEDSFIIAPDQLFQKNSITVQDQKEAVIRAQEEMIEQIREHTTLIRSAEKQAQELIENYIQQIGKLTSVEYRITWDMEAVSE